MYSRLFERIQAIYFEFEEVVRMYGFIRFEKYKKANNLCGIGREAYRTEQQHERGAEFNNSDIDWTRTKKNIFIKTPPEYGCYMRDGSKYQASNLSLTIKNRLEQKGIKPKKDAVLCVGVVAGASAEFFREKSVQEIEEYFREIKEELVSSMCGGDESRLLGAVVHMDEDSPHLQAHILPLVDRDGQEALCCKEILGGVQKLRGLQDRFYENVFSHYGLDRGEKTINQTPEEKRKHRETMSYKVDKLQQEIDGLSRRYQIIKDNIQALEASESLIDGITKEQAQTIQEIREKAFKVSESLNKPRKGLFSNDVLQQLKDQTYELERLYSQIRQTQKKEIELVQQLETVSENLESIVEQRAQTIALDMKEAYHSRLERVQQREVQVQNKEDKLKETIEQGIEQGLGDYQQDVQNFLMRRGLWDSFVFERLQAIKKREEEKQRQEEQAIVHHRIRH